MITKIKMPVNGILLLNKALHASSNKALQQVKRLFNAKKAGHTGSLDPLATGVLPLCFGEATKFSQYLLDADKIYIVEGRLGCTTITGDAEGKIQIIDNAPVISAIMLENALKNFMGEIQQVPPMYSALKKEGIPLYELARAGKEVERKARTITIYSIQLNTFTYPDFQISVHCSKGTYIRTLVEDIGKYLNSGAYLLNLRRDKAGPYLIEKAFTWEQLESVKKESLHSLLLPADTAVAHFPAIYLKEEESQQIQQGKQMDYHYKNAEYTSGIVRLYSDNSDKKIFLGLGDLSVEGQLRAKRLIATNLCN